MAKQKKYYVIWRGHQTGIFSSWNECKKNVQGFTGAEYKSFKSKELAEEAYQGNYWEFAGKDKMDSGLSKEELAKLGTPVWKSLSVDAACSSAGSQLMEYQGVETATKQVVFRQGPFPEGTNNVGEFLALVHGLAFLKKHNSKLPIYSDSRTAMKWVRTAYCNTTLKKTRSNAKLFDLIKRGETWLKNNTYENEILKWETKAWGEIPADFGRK